MSGDSTTNAFLQRIDEGYYHRQEFIEETWRQQLNSLTPEECRELEAARLAELQNHPPHSPSPPPTDGRILRDSPPFGPSAESCPASPLAHSPAPLDSPITLPTSIPPPIIPPPPHLPPSPSLRSPAPIPSPPYTFPPPSHAHPLLPFCLAHWAAISPNCTLTPPPSSQTTYAPSPIPHLRTSTPPIPTPTSFL